MTIRLIGAAVAAATLTAVAPAATIHPELRVEGAARAILPGLPADLQTSAARTVTVRDTTDADTVLVPARSATAQLQDVTFAFGIPLGFDLSDFGTGPASFVTRIGGDRMPPSFSPSWRLKVNHKLTDTGADATLLSARDTVLWSFVRDFEAPELDLRVGRRRTAVGRPVDVRVLRFDNAGAATPAIGARVRVAGRSARTDRAGRASLRVARAGTYWISATLAGAVRSPKRLLCVQAAPTATPCSAVTFPRPAEHVRRASLIAGTVAHVPASGASRVDVSLARVTAGGCRFLTRDRRTFGPPRPCSAGTTIGVGLRVGPDGEPGWTLRIPGPRLGAGRYRVQSRQVAGTLRERAATPGMNTVDFIVTGGSAP